MTYAELEERAQKCVCKFCGGPLEIRVIIYNQYGGQGLDLYCPHCDKIEYGIDPEYYQIAKEFVGMYKFNYYTDMAEGVRNDQMNYAKVAEIGDWFMRRFETNYNKHEPKTE